MRKGKTKAERAKDYQGEEANYWPRMREVYKHELAREIAEAKREMPYTPPYRPPTDRNGEPL